jgi:hypothetical protein
MLVLDRKVLPMFPVLATTADVPVGQQNCSARTNAYANPIHPPRPTAAPLHQSVTRPLCRRRLPRQQSGLRTQLIPAASNANAPTATRYSRRHR